MSEAEPANPPTTPDADSRRDPGGPLGASLAWAAITALVALMIVIAGLEPPPPEPAPTEDAAVTAAEVPPPGGLFTLTTRVLLGAGNTQEQAQSLDMMGMFAASDADDLRMAIVAAEVLGPEEGVDRIDRLLESNKDLSDRLREDAQLFRAVYADSPDELLQNARDGLVERHEWFATLALTFNDENDVARQEILASARKAYFIQSMMTVAIVALLVAGVLLFLVSIGLIAGGVFRRAYAPPTPGGSVFVETFALFLISFLLLTLIGELLKPALGTAALLLNWLVLPVALWPMLRGLPIANLKHALGWHAGRGAFRELALGLVGYVACLPIIGLGVLITLGLTSIFGSDEGSAPSHPLGDMIANASTFEIIVIVQLATVWAPVVEETFFRGALYHHLRGRLHHLPAGLLVGIIFAAIHPQGLLAIPALAAIGLSLALIREWRGSILGSVAAHAANNGFIVTLLLLLLSA